MPIKTLSALSLPKVHTKTKLIAVAVTVSMLQACATYDPYTGEKGTAKATIGAGVGAGVAAIVAYMNNKNADSTKRRQRILKAATAGGAIGGGIGYYMDKQESQLRQQLRSSGVSIQRDGNNINLIMPGNITFDTASSEIKQNFFEVLNSVALVLKKYDKTLVVVSGYTDSVGAAEYNQTLSQQRASSVSNYLNGKGIIRERLETIGFGETRPVASNETPEGREQNRRVEITLLPITEPAESEESQF